MISSGFNDCCDCLPCTLHGCFSLPQWAKCPSPSSWGNGGRNYMSKRVEQPLLWRWGWHHNKHRHQLGNQLNFSKLVPPLFHVSIHILQWWLGLGVITAVAIPVPLELRVKQDVLTAEPTCVLLRREMNYLNLPCVSRVRCNWCHAIQIKLGGTHLQSWDARLEGLPASSLPARAQLWGIGLAGASPAPVPPNKPAQSHFLLTDLLQKNGPCEAQPLQESRVAPGIKKNFLFWVKQLMLYFFSTLPNKFRK